MSKHKVCYSSENKCYFYSKHKIVLPLSLVIQIHIPGFPSYHEWADLDFDSISEKTVEGLVNKFRHSIAKTPLMNATNGKPIGNVTISGGVCGSNTASGTGDILAKTEAALELSKKKKGNQVTLYEERKSGDSSLERNAWSLYNEAG